MIKCTISTTLGKLTSTDLFRTFDTKPTNKLITKAQASAGSMGWAFEQHVMGYEVLETQLVGFMEDEVGE